MSNSKSKESIVNIRTASKKSYNNLPNSNNLLSHRRNRAKYVNITLLIVYLSKVSNPIKGWRNYHVFKISQMNLGWYNDALEKHESNGLLASWKHHLLRYNHWSLAKRCISTKFVYTLHRLRTSSIHRANERNWFHIKRGKKSSIFHCSCDRWNDADDQAIIVNTLAQAESQLNSQEKAAGVSSFNMNANKPQNMCLNRT